MLGNDVSKDVRQRLQARSDSKQGAAAKRFSLRPNAAAQEVLLRGGEALGLSFFHAEPLAMKGFDQEDLDVFNEVRMTHSLDKGGQISRLSLTKPYTLHPKQGNVGPLRIGGD